MEMIMVQAHTISEQPLNAMNKPQLRAYISEPGVGNVLKTAIICRTRGDLKLSVDQIQKWEMWSCNGVQF